MALVSDSSNRSGSSGGGGSVRGSRRARPGVTTVALAVTVVASAAAACWKVAGSLQRLCPTPGGSALVGREGDQASWSSSLEGHAATTTAATAPAAAVGAAGRPPSHPPRLVFIDAGGNTGQTVEWFRNGSALAGDIFRSVHHTTSADPAAYEVFVFEPNRVFSPQYEALRARGLDFTLIPGAVADADGWVDFSGTGQGGLVSEGGVRVTAAPTVRFGGDSGGGGGDGGGGNGAVTLATDGWPGEVPALDFSAWLSRTFAPDDYLLCKIDVEGSETAVLRKMLLDGTLCACNRLSVEWHMWLGVPGNPHAIGMNSPAALADDTAGGRVVGADGGGTAYTCTIPHARRHLPYAECVLPKMVEWVRRACPASAPLEKWF